MVPTLPSWWKDLFPFAPHALQEILRQVSASEFYQGLLGPDLSIHLKDLGREVEITPPWAHSPKLGRILLGFLPGGDQHSLYHLYENRGSKGQGGTSLVVSDHPWDVLSMGSSRRFSSCQDLTESNRFAGHYSSHLPANLLDSGMVVAYLPEANSGRWDIQRMSARVILRLFRSKLGAWGVLIDRFYGDPGQVLAMEHALSAHLQRHGLRHFSTPNYYRHEKFESREGTSFRARGPLQFFARGVSSASSPSTLRYRLPYLDQRRGGNTFYWRRFDAWRYPRLRELHALSARLVEVQPMGRNTQ